jgi:hypothetical protein
MTRIVVLLVWAVSCAMPALATDENVSFVTPSGNIICGYRDVDGLQAIRCDIKERNQSTPVLPMPEDCDADWGNMFVIGRTGAATLECAGDLAANPESSPVLGYGNVIKEYGVTCMSEKAGLTCINTEGHGFTLSRAQQKLF